jgi:hypothetical protein
MAQLGEEKYNTMMRDHYQKTKKYGAFEKKQLYEILKKQYENKDHLKDVWTVIW